MACASWPRTPTSWCATPAPTSGSEAAASFIVPKKPLNLLKNSLSGTNAEVTVEYNENNASFTFDNILLVCRLIDGKYPNYEAVIPKKNPNKLTIDRADLPELDPPRGHLQQQDHAPGAAHINGSQLAVSAEDLDFANEANEKLTCGYEGEDMTIGFNSRFLMDMLNNLDSEHVCMEMSAPNRAGILLPGESGEARRGCVDARDAGDAQQLMAEEVTMKMPPTSGGIFVDSTALFRQCTIWSF
jgi:DNA polymerase-3 subunit beta